MRLLELEDSDARDPKAGWPAPSRASLLAGLIVLLATAFGGWAVVRASPVCSERFGREELRLSLLSMGWDALSADVRTQVEPDQIRRLRLPYTRHAYLYPELAVLLGALPEAPPWQARREEQVLGATLEGRCEEFRWAIVAIHPDAAGAPPSLQRIEARVRLGNRTREGLHAARVLDGVRSGDTVLLRLPDLRFVSGAEVCVRYDERTDRRDTGAEVYFRADVCRSASAP